MQRTSLPAGRRRLGQVLFGVMQKACGEKGKDARERGTLASSVCTQYEQHILYVISSHKRVQTNGPKVGVRLREALRELFWRGETETHSEGAHEVQLPVRVASTSV